MGGRMHGCALEMATESSCTFFNEGSCSEGHLSSDGNEITWNHDDSKWTKIQAVRGLSASEVQPLSAVQLSEDITPVSSDRTSSSGSSPMHPHREENQDRYLGSVPPLNLV